MNQPPLTKPNFPAVVKRNHRIRKGWPAYRANNDRYLCTVRACASSLDEDFGTPPRLNVTHQPSGRVVTFDLPFELALLVSDALFALVGDDEEVEYLKENFADLPENLRRWLRNPDSDVPKAIENAAKQTRGKNSSKARRRLNALGTPPTARKRAASAAGQLQTRPALTRAEFTKAVEELERKLEFIAAKWDVLRRISEAQKRD